MPFRISNLAEYQSEYQHSLQNPEAFWAEKADTFTWRKKWDQVLDWNFAEPNIKWFLNGKLNITENCLDRHLAARGNKLAIIYEPNDPHTRHLRLTYASGETALARFVKE